MALDSSNTNVSSTISITVDPRTTGETAIQAISMCLILSSGIIGNILILLAIYIDKTLQTVTNAFVVNLACADLLLSLLGMPFTLVSSITYDWIFGPVWCDINGMANSLFCVASMLTLAAVSIDRYIAIIHPLHYTSYMTNRMAAGMIIYIWLHSLIIALLPVIGWSKYTFLKKESICTVHWELEISCTVFIFVVCFFFPFAIMTFTYSRILKTAWKQSKRIVPVTGRFSERKKHKERLDSSTCEPISVGSLDSANRVSNTGSTNVHTSLSNEDNFTIPPEKQPAKKTNINTERPRMQSFEGRRLVENVKNSQEFTEAYTKQNSTRSKSGTNDGSTTYLDTFPSDYSPNCDGINSSMESDSSVTLNSSSIKQLIDNQMTIKNNNYCESTEAWTQRIYTRDRSPQDRGVQGIVHHTENYSINYSSKQTKVKKDVCNESSNSAPYSPHSGDVFFPLEDQKSGEKCNETEQNRQQNDEIRSKQQASYYWYNNRLPPLSDNTKGNLQDESLSATPQSKVGVIVTSESPSQSPQATPKRRRVTVATFDHSSPITAESDTTKLNENTNHSIDTRQENANNISTSTPCLQKTHSKTSLDVDKAPKRKLSAFRRPNIQALRKKSINPNALLRLKQEKKAVRTLLIVVGTFVICWLPHFIGIFCILTKECTWPDRYFAITTWLAMLNSGCNPVIYGAMSRQFRKRFRQILQCKRGFF